MDLFLDVENGVGGQDTHNDPPSADLWPDINAHLSGRARASTSFRRHGETKSTYKDSESSLEPKEHIFV